MKISKKFTTVTPFSKLLFLTMLVFLPFIGFALGIKYKSLAFTNEKSAVIETNRIQNNNYGGLEIEHPLSNSTVVSQVNSLSAPYIITSFYTNLSPYMEVSISFTKKPKIDVIKSIIELEGFRDNQTEIKYGKDKSINGTLLEGWTGEAGSVYSKIIISEKDESTYIVNIGSFDKKDIRFDKVLNSIDL